MSRGPGRWQRLLLHELYHKPVAAGLFGGLYVRRLVSAEYPSAEHDSEYAAIRRAARGLVAKGYARNFHGYAHTLFRVDPAPEINCPQCGRKCSESANAEHNSEHLTKCSEGLNSAAPRNTYPVGSVQGMDGKWYTRPVA